jgi:hypothetical protein
VFVAASLPHTAHACAIDEVYVLLDSTYSTDAGTCDKIVDNANYMDQCTANGTAPFAAPNYYATVDDGRRLALNLMTKGIDVGLVQYGSAVQVEWKLGDHTANAMDMQVAFDRLRWKAYFGTELAPAILEAASLFSETSAEHKKSLVVITDGKYQDEDAALLAAEKVRAEGFSLWIFAWGPRVFNDQEEAMAHFVLLTGSMNQVLIVENPAGVSTWLDVERLCAAPVDELVAVAPAADGFNWALIGYVIAGIVAALLLLVLLSKKRTEIERQPVQATSKGNVINGNTPPVLMDRLDFSLDKSQSINQASSFYGVGAIGSNLSNGSMTLRPPKPMFYPNGGTFTGVLYLHISHTQEMDNTGSPPDIRYTVDGGEPTDASPLYTGKPILIGTLGNDERLQHELGRGISGPISVLDTLSDEFVVRAVAFTPGAAYGGGGSSAYVHASEVAVARFCGAQSVGKLSPVRGQHGQSGHFVSHPAQSVSSASQAAEGGATLVSPMVFPPVLG